jgi:hypothetical protein
MDIETITLNAFLHKLSSDPFSNIHMDYELSGWSASGSSNLHISLRGDKAKICRKIIRVLEDVQVNIPKPITWVIFHNGSKYYAYAKNYDGKNDEVLQGKLPQEDYADIVSSIKSNRSLIFYHPEIASIIPSQV